MLETTPLNSTVRGTGRAHLFNLIFMGLGFIGIFSAYKTLGLMERGNRLHLLLLRSYALGSLFVAPSLSKYLRPKLSMIIGGFTYAAFIGGNLYPSWFTLIPLATLLGLGASLLWAGEGSYLTAAAGNYANDRQKPLKSAFGLFNGIFFAMFQLTQVIGNLVGSLVLTYDTSASSIKILFYVLLGLAVFGLLLLLLLRKEEAFEERTTNDSVLQKVLQAFILMKDVKMIFLIPVLFYNGLEMGFIFGDFTRQVVAEELGPHSIGFVMAIFGAVDAISSGILGKVSDLIGKRVVVSIGTVSHLIFFGVALSYPLYLDSIPHPHISIPVAAAVYAIGDAVWNTFPNIMMSVFFTDQTEAAFSLLKLFSSLGFSCAYVWGPLLPLYVKEFIVGGVLVVSVVCIFILDRFISPLDPPPRYQSINSYFPD